jgi:peptidoglycan-N-acetylglucosamine deacetylase
MRTKRNYLLFQPNYLVKQLYRGALWKVKSEGKEIYLTFDDGPVPGLTEWVLDELKRYGAKATFFCVGDNIRKYPDVFRRIIDEGHTAANHTMHHLKGFKSNVRTYLKEADECRELVGNDLFRPPYGQLTRLQYKALKRKGYRVVFWDVISYDYENIHPRQCLNTTLRNTRSGSIVLFHDNVKAEKNLRYTLPLFLKHFANLRFEFKALKTA